MYTKSFIATPKLGQVYISIFLMNLWTDFGIKLLLNILLLIIKNAGIRFLIKTCAAARWVCLCLGAGEMTKFVFVWQERSWEIFVSTPIVQLVHLSDVTEVVVTNIDIGIKSLSREVIIPLSSVAYVVIIQEQ